MNELELGRQAIEILRTISRCGCRNIRCSECILGTSKSNVCEVIGELITEVNSLED